MIFHKQEPERHIWRHMIGHTSEVLDANPQIRVLRRARAAFRSWRERRWKHAEAFTIRWAFELVFTSLTALYQFVVLGIRLYFPLGFIALAIASVWFARQQR